MSLFTEAVDRLKQYNLGIYNAASNLFGLSGVGGMAANWSRHSKDVATVGEGVASMAEAVAASESSAAGSATAAAGSATSAHASEVAAAGSATAAAGSASAAASSATAASDSAGNAASSASSASTGATLSGQYANAAGGSIPSVRLTWDTATADVDPGNGKVRLNNATATAATALFVDNLDATGASITTVLDRWTASTNTTKGTLRIAHRTDSSKWVEYQVTGTVVDGTGYRKIPVTGGTGPGGFAAGDPVAVGFSRAGDMPTSFAAGTTAAPGWAVTGDSNTGLAQIGGPDTLSMVPGGSEVIRTSPNAAKVYGAMTIGDRGDGFGAALTLTPGAGPDWHIYSRVSDGALVFYHFKNKAGTTVSIERMVLRENGAVDFNQTPTVNGTAMTGGLFAGTAGKSANYTVIASDARYLIEATAALTLLLTAAATLGSGFTFAAWNHSTGTVIVDPNGSELINGAATLTLLPGQWAFITCTGTAWKALTQTSQSTCVWSSTDKESSLIVTNGGLTASVASGGAMQSGRGTVALSGQKYFEAAVDVVAASGLTAIVGIATAAAAFGSTFGLATSANGYGFASDTGNKLNNSSQSAYSSAWGTAGYIVGIAYDDVSTPGTVKIWLSINGVWQASGNPATGANPAFSVSSAVFYPAVTCKNGGQVTARFTAASWSYSAPAGFTQVS